MRYRTTIKGAWHIHLLLKAMNVKHLYIPNDEIIAKLWGHGHTKTKRLNDVDNIGAYLSAYLTNLEDGGKGQGFIYILLVLTYTGQAGG